MLLAGQNSSDLIVYRADLEEEGEGGLGTRLEMLSFLCNTLVLAQVLVLGGGAAKIVSSTHLAFVCSRLKFLAWN